MQETQDFDENQKENLPRSAVSQNSEPRTKLLDWKAEREKKINEEVAEKASFCIIIRIDRHHVYCPVSTSNVSIASMGTSTKKFQY